MKCPQCGSRSLHIGVAFSGMVECFFSNEDEFEVTDTVSLHSEWSDDSSCQCARCAWEGTVAEARSGSDSAAGRRDRAISSRSSSSGQAEGSGSVGVATQAAVRSIEDVERMLRERPVEQPCEQAITFLLGRVRYLEALLESITRAQAKERESGSGNDTSLM